MTERITPPPVPEAPSVLQVPAEEPPIPEYRPENPDEPEKKSISASLSTMWIYIVSQFGVSFVLSFVTGILITVSAGFGGFYFSLEMQDFITNLTLILTAAISGVLAIVYASRKMNIQITQNLFDKVKDKGDYIKGICASYALQVPLSLVIMGLSALINILTGTPIPQTGSEGALTLGGNLMYFILAVLVAPVIEEIVFRGLILNGLKKYSVSFAILFSSLCFGLLHMNLYQGIPVVGMGIAFGYMYCKTGSLRVPIAMHMFNNLISVLATIFPLPASEIFSNSGILFALLGFYFIYKDWKEIRSTFVNSAPSGRLWSILTHKVSFWLLVALFMISSLFIIFMPMMF